MMLRLCIAAGAKASRAAMPWSSFMARVLIFLAVMMGMLWPFTTRAAYPLGTPDTLQIQEIHVYRHTAELNDQLYLVKFNNYYTTLPTDDLSVTVPIGTAFMARLLNGSTSAELASAVPYGVYRSGYSIGAVAFYFAAGSTPTWNPATQPNIKLEGNPTLSWSSSPPPNVVSNTMTWHATSTIAATQALLGPQIITYAKAFETAWTGQDVWQTLSGNDVLADTGETYFINIIPLLKTMVPLIFSTTATTPTITTPGYALLTANAASGQATVTVASTTGFSASDRVLVKDSAASEALTISTVNTSTKVVTMTTNLANSYTTANGASLTSLETAYSRTNRLRITGLRSSFDTLASDFGLSGMWLSAGLWLVIYGLVVWLLSKLLGRFDSSGSSSVHIGIAAVLAIPLWPFGWWIGMVSQAIIAGMAAIAAILFVGKLAWDRL